MKYWKRFCALALVLSLSVLLAACGGGGGGGATGGAGGGGGTPASGSQGTVASPILIPAGSTYSGTVSLSGPSYYEYTGLIGGAAYSVTLSNITNSILPIFYSSNTTSNSQTCFFSTVSGTASCIVKASPAGNILIQVTDFSINPTSYTISAALAVDPGQGLPTAPIAFALGATASGALTAGVSTTTFDTGNSGYYQLTGLTANHQYSITLAASAGSAQLHAYQGSYSMEAVLGCSGISCTVTSSGTSLLLQVRATDTATYTISAVDNGPVTPYTSQGAIGTEVALKLDTPDVFSAVLTNGSVNTTKSYYTISGLVPGQRYDTYLSNIQDAVNLYVYTDAAYTKLACSAPYTSLGSTSQRCMATPTAAGQIWIVVDGSTAQTRLGSNFFIGAKRVAQTQGTSTTPVVVNSATDLPFRANWTSGSTSYYKITGLPANTTMMVTSQSDHTWVQDYGNLAVYNGTGFGTMSCQTQTHAPMAYQSCTGTTDASGNLYVSFDTGFFPLYPEGGTAYINVKTVPVSEGTSTAPLAKTLSTPFTGQVASGTGYSYYAVTGLAASAPYHILATFGTDGQPASLDVYNTFTSGNLTTETPACSTSWIYLNEGCTATADASGRLWVRMGGWTTDNGSNYTIEALAVPVNKGTSVAPVNITGLMPYRTTVTAAGTDYFMTTGLTVGSEYAFSDNDSSGGDYITVFNDSALTSQVCSTFALPNGRRSNTCRGVSTSGTAYIVVYGSNASYFTLDMALVPAAAGTAAAPIAYTSQGSLLAGTVNVGASYYKVTLSPNTPYTVTLSTVTGDPDLHVFNAAAMTGAEACSSLKGKNLAETCQATSDANGNLWITVDGQMSKSGGSYQLKVN